MPTSPMSPALAGRFFTTGATWEARFTFYLTAIAVLGSWPQSLLHGKEERRQQSVSQTK